MQPVPFSPDHPPMMRCVNDEATRRLRHVLSVLSAPQGQQRTNVRNVLQALEEGHQVHQVTVRRVANPALYGYGIVWRRTNLSACAAASTASGGPPTLMKHVAQRAVVQNHDLAQVRLN